MVLKEVSKCLLPTTVQAHTSSIPTKTTTTTTRTTAERVVIYFALLNVRTGQQFVWEAGVKAQRAHRTQASDLEAPHLSSIGILPLKETKPKKRSTFHAYT